MTIGYTGAWESKAGVMVRDTGAKKQVSQSVKVQQMLTLVGNDPNALNVAEMDKQGLRRRWGASRLADDLTPHHFIGVINE